MSAPPISSGPLVTSRRQLIEWPLRTITVLVVEHQSGTFETTSALVNLAFEAASVHRASWLDEAPLEAAGRLTHLDLVILDVATPDSAVIEILIRLLPVCGSAPVLVLSANEKPGAIIDVLAAGAAGYVPRNTPPNIAKNALQLVAGGGSYIPSQVLAGLGDPPGRPRAPRISHGARQLTPRQMQVLRLVSQGLSNQQVAQALGISAETVKQHLQSAYAVLGASSRIQAVLAAKRFGIDL